MGKIFVEVRGRTSNKVEERDWWLVTNYKTAINIIAVRTEFSTMDSGETVEKTVYEVKWGEELSRDNFIGIVHTWKSRTSLRRGGYYNESPIKFLIGGKRGRCVVEHLKKRIKKCKNIQYIYLNTYDTDEMYCVDTGKWVPAEGDVNNPQDRAELCWINECR